MPSPAVIGAVAGLGVQLYVNAVRKLPLLRNPWHHAIAISAGAAFGSWIVKFEEQTEKELEVMLKKRDETNARLRQ